MKLQRWEVSDHTAGGYFDPHKPEDCNLCREDGNNGAYYLASEVDARISELERIVDAQKVALWFINEHYGKESIKALLQQKIETGLGL